MEAPKKASSHKKDSERNKRLLWHQRATYCSVTEAIQTIESMANKKDTTASAAKTTTKENATKESHAVASSDDSNGNGEYDAKPHADQSSQQIHIMTSPSSDAAAAPPSSSSASSAIAGIATWLRDAGLFVNCVVQTPMWSMSFCCAAYLAGACCCWRRGTAWCPRPSATRCGSTCHSLRVGSLGGRRRAIPLDRLRRDDDAVPQSSGLSVGRPLPPRAIGPDRGARRARERYIFLYQQPARRDRDGQQRGAQHQRVRLWNAPFPGVCAATASRSTSASASPSFASGSSLLGFVGGRPGRSEAHLATKAEARAATGRQRTTNNNNNNQQQQRNLHRPASSSSRVARPRPCTPGRESSSSCGAGD